MNNSIAHIVKNYIINECFVDKISGLVQTAYMTVTDDKGVKVTKSFPISCDTAPLADCKEGVYNDLTPDSKYKTVIYFEDGGITYNGQAGVMKCYTSRLKLVCWINVGLLTGELCPGGDPCTVSARIIALIICALPTHPVNTGIFARLFPVVKSQDIRSNSIFSKYTYNEKQTQYLMYPYDYFSLNIETDFCTCEDNCERCPW